VTPRFAVVGHPNKGKSSIVATLAEDDAVAISPLPGTTTRAKHYPFRVDGDVLYELIDTPGFQRPRETLAWLKDHHPAAHQRSETVAAFVAAHRDDRRFFDECELLQPLLDGAGVLYVVDGSKPYGSEYEPEMEILRWTGRPGMALINMIGDGDYIDEWRRALHQFFAIVRVFDATRADFDKRIALLRGFGELDESWQGALERAVDVLQRERRRRQHQAAVEVTDLVIDVVTRQVALPLPPGSDAGPLEDRLRQAGLSRLLSVIRKREEQARAEVQGLYRHGGLSRQEREASLLDVDLFSEEAWRVFGLSKGQLAATGVVSGVAAGSAFDLMLGGASLGVAAGIGGLLGGASAFMGMRRLARIRVMGLPLGGRELLVGPVRDLNFPWVILGRAVLHHRMIAERNHARRESLLLESTANENFADTLPVESRRAIDRALARIRSQGGADRAQRERLEGLIEPLLAGKLAPSGAHSHNG
jgi:hypothetical protein